MSLRPRHTWSPTYAVDGLTAGIGGLAIAALGALALSAVGAVGGEAMPLAAVGAAFVDRTPLWLKTLAVQAFGTSDKTALWVGMALVILALLASIGAVARTRHTLALTSLAALGAVVIAAVVTREGARLLDVLPTLVGVAGAVIWLDRRARIARSEDADAPDARAATRRSVLGLGAATAGFAATSWWWARGTGPTLDDIREQIILPEPVSSEPHVAAADMGTPGAVPWQVPTGDFYRIDTALVVPQVDPGTWRLRVYGEVEQEVEITWADLLRRPMVERWVTLACVSNEIGGDLVGNALWLGWPVRELLAMARPRAGADMVLSRSVDGWTAGTPLETLTDDRNALLAVGMNRQPLTAEHGFPVRLVVPGLYGYVSATKWVTELKVTRFAVDMGYWTPRGWSAFGPVKTASRIDVPRSGREVRAGLVPVAGVAWAMHRGIAAVQVSVDGGPWRDARLAGQPTVDAWRQWAFDWDAPPGAHTLSVRAQDGTGEWQPATVTRSDPDGATGHHTVTVRVA